MTARDNVRVMAKEVRAIAPAWAACVAAMFAWKVPRGDFQSLLQAIGIAAYFVGAPAVGALSVGHEFTCGTWSFLLTQPADRRRMLWTKFGVLVAALLLLGAFAMWLQLMGRVNELGPGALLIPLVLGAFVAPWLTLVVRRSVGGAVFAAAIPAVLVLAGRYVGVRIYGYVADADKVARGFVEIGVLAACIAGAILGWRRFVLFEAVEGGPAHGREVQHTSVSDSTSVSRINPLWLLAAKEIRLQQLTFGVAAFYVAAYCVSVETIGSLTDFAGIAAALTILYGTLLSVVAGAIASAEERQMGTLDSQLLLPVAVGRQWTVKVAIVVAIAVSLGYLLPLTIASLLPPPGVSARAIAGDITHPIFGIYAAMMAAISLYVSSVCRTTLSALVLAFPVYATLAILFRKIVDPVMRTSYRWVHAREPARFMHYGDPVGTVVLLVVAALLVTLVIRMALANHRYTDRSVSRVVAHAVLFVAGLTAALAVLGVLAVF